MDNPNLEEFLKPKEERRKATKVEVKTPKKRRPMSVNAVFRDTEGVTYGLYNRFYWDQKGVPFGGQPHF